MRPSTRRKAFIFDLDGTLVDSLPGIEFSVDYTFAKHGLPARKRDLRPLIGPPIRQIFAQLLSHADEHQLSELESTFRACYDSIGWRKTTLLSNAASTLVALNGAGSPVFLATNKPALATGLILEATGIRNQFREVLCRDSRTPGFQSKGEMLRILIHKYGLTPAECLYVGDTFEDHVAGAEAGVPVAILTHPFGVAEPEPSRCPGGVTLNNLAELLHRQETN